MKPNELMIGDWLQYKGQYNAFTFRVEQITKRKVGYHAEPGECRIHYLRLCEFQPILPTTEILEKNGFEIHEGEMEMYGVTTSPYYVIEGSPYIFCDGDSFSVRFEDEVNIKYVHELQHILRLCVIKKEIVP